MKGLGYGILVLGWIGVRGFGPGVDWGSRFWCWGGLGFEVLVLGWIGVRSFGVFSRSLGKAEKIIKSSGENSLLKKRTSSSQLVDFSADQL